MRFVPIFFHHLAWYDLPVKSKTLVRSIKGVDFPSVTLCPEDSNTDRWGPAIKVFDHLLINCHQR